MLKNITLGLALLCFVSIGYSQNETDSKLNKNGIRVGWNFNNRQFGIDQTGLTETDNYTQGMEFTYIRKLTNQFNLGFPLTLASNRVDDIDNLDEKEAYLGLDVVGQLLITPRRYKFSPYVFAGVGGEWQMFNDNDLTGSIPLGVGIDYNIKEDLFAGIRGAYRVGFENNDYLQLNIGLTALLGKVADKVIPVIISDADGDGINDNEDACPNVAGVYAFKGCPDTDEDGVEDSKDECPEIAGLIELNGCPAKDTDGDGVVDDSDDCPEIAGNSSMNGCPDTDKDGIRDIDDKCPNEPGVLAEGGCPPPADSDGDGIPDNADDCPKAAGSAAMKGCPDIDKDGIRDLDDKCPNIAGTRANNGCPELAVEEKAILQRAKESIEFETNSAVIRSSSIPILEEVVGLMRRYPPYHAKIGGHTDSAGPAEPNKILSEKRAKACYDYLVSKGISGSRLSYQGYGEIQPIGDNKYEEGRRKNRRVEFDLFVP